MPSYSPADILTKEVRHVNYCPSDIPGEADRHYIKEIIHLKDGTIVPNLHYVEDFEYDFYVTKKYHQNHEKKKEWEEVSKLDKFTTTRRALDKNIARALKRPGFGGDPRKLRDSQFLYGSDIASTAIIKHDYQTKYDLKTTFHSVSVFDVETNVLGGIDDIIMATLSFKDRIVTAVQAKFVAGIVEPEVKVRALLNKYLTEVEFKDDKAPGGTKIVDLIAERNIKWDFVIVPNEIEVVRYVFKRAHEWKPDFMTIWNMNFDIPKVLEACERANCDPALIFCDPDIPLKYRNFKYVQGKAKKRMASGKEMAIKIADRWHTVFAPASFYVVDSMCVYRKVRAANGEEPSYGLDAILTKEKLPRKLKFKEADGLEDLELHRFMQKNYPLEYIIYNVFDCIAVELLDEQVKDLADAMPSRCGWSDYDAYKSQPRMTVEEIHYEVLANDCVLATLGSDMTEEMDDDTLSINDWVVNLRAAFITKNGLNCIKELPSLPTAVYSHVGDRTIILIN